MSLARQGSDALPSHVATGNRDAILGAILLPMITLALWQRALAPSLARWVEAFDLSSVDDLHFTTSKEALAADLSGAFEEAGYARSPGAELLRLDIEALARCVLDIFEDPVIEVRLEVVETDACRKFHADYVAARLVTTYRGPGTEWLDRADSRAFAAGVPMSELTIRRAGTGDIVLMKGRLWAPEDALIHRSPPIAGTGVQRLVLAINPVPEDGMPHISSRSSE